MINNNYHPIKIAAQPSRAKTSFVSCGKPFGTQNPILLPWFTVSNSSAHGKASLVTTQPNGSYKGSGRGEWQVPASSASRSSVRIRRVMFIILPLAGWLHFEAYRTFDSCCELRRNVCYCRYIHHWL